MAAHPDWLPELMLLADSGGDWQRYLAAIYSAFRADFVTDRPKFNGRRCACKRHPMIDGKEATFWHLISEGAVEADRLPDLRRCERIRWPRPMIERSPNDIRVWKSERPGDQRIVIALDDFSYVVVLADRGEYVILWTAYCVEQDHRRAKLRREWERAQKSWGRP
jgi:hypothetical protein